MDSFFEILPTIIFALVILSRFVKSLKDRTEQNQESLDDSSKKRYKKEDKVEIEKSTSLNANPSKDNLEGLSKVVKRDKSYSKDRGVSNSTIKANQKIKKDRDKNKALKLKAKKDDIIRGVIWKEILDKPRAKRPYGKR